MEEEMKLSEEQKEKLELIRKEFEENPNLKTKENVQIKTNETLKEFNAKFLKNNLKDLTLEKYCKNKKDYFLYWLETKTNWSKNNNVSFGNSKPGTMNLWGLYYSPKSNSYKYKKDIISEEKAKQIFEEKLKPFWIEVLNLIKSNNIKDIAKIKQDSFYSKQFIIKFINLIKYNQYILITNENILKKIAIEYNITSNSTNIFELFENISEFFRKNLKEIEIKDLSNYLWNKFGEKSKTYLEKYLEKHNFNSDYIDTVIKHSEFHNNLEEIYFGNSIKFGDRGFDFSGFKKSKSKDLYFLFITEKDNYYYVGLTIITNKSGDSNKNSEYELDWIDKSKIKINCRISDLNFINFDNDNENFISKALEKYFNPEPPQNIKSNILKKKKQIILYGPPGTGKTFNTKNIIFNFFNENLLEKNNKEDVDNSYKELEKEKRVKFITFHQFYAYEEFIEGIKPNLDGEKEISYNIENGSFKDISKLPEANYKKSKLEKIEIDYEKLLDLFSNNILEEIENNEEFILDKNIKIVGVNYNNELFQSFIIGGSVKSKQNLTKKIILRDLPNLLNEKIISPNDIKPTFESKSIRHGNAIYYFKLYNKLLDFYKSNIIKENSLLLQKEDLKPYFLIIDEINRGNISKIFGELITLLESDKRLGQENELITTLPYSKEKFGIPPNLYIIATMNTSDKSIATLDVALRRRFGFIEMLPNYNLDEITTNCEEINLQELLKTINKRIEFLLDKDHLIGHSYFMNIKSIKELKEVFYNEIIPLLEEYFYGDYEKLQLVLGKKFVIKNNEFKESLFENNEIIDFEEIKYKINKFKIDEKLDNFKEAIENIIKPKENKKESNE